MANEIQVDLSLYLYKTSIMAAPLGRALKALLVTMTGTNYIENVLNVLTSATALPLGSVTSPGWFFGLNKDTVSNVSLRNGASGANVAQLKPGEPCLFRWDPLAVPYAIASANTSLLEYLLIAA